MNVCEKCHSIDRKVTGCPIVDAKYHGSLSYGGECDICGKKVATVYCWHYRGLMIGEKDK